MYVYKNYLPDMDNGHIWVLSQPGHPLAAIDTPKAADPCQK